MKIKHVIIHELIKEGGTTGARLVKYNSVIDHEDIRVVKLVNEINGRYKNRSETYSTFDEEKSTKFHTSFDDYFKDDLSEKEFINFSIVASEDLTSRIDTNAPAKGGYLIFVNYEANRKYVGVFLVRNTLGLSFNTKNPKKTFNIDDVQHIDFENLALACRINTEAYQKTEIRYLSFINNKGDVMSQYFIRWISTSKTETNKADTKIFYDLMLEIDLPVNPETEEKYDRFEFLDKVYNYIKSSKEKLVNIRVLSEHFYGESSFVPDYIEKQGKILNGEFKPYSEILKKFIQIKVKADKVELTFPNSIYKETVTIVGNQIIINSQSLVDAIKTSLKQE